MGVGIRPAESSAAARDGECSGGFGEGAEVGLRGPAGGSGVAEGTAAGMGPSAVGPSAWRKQSAAKKYGRLGGRLKKKVRAA